MVSARTREGIGSRVGVSAAVAVLVSVTAGNDGGFSSVSVVCEKAVSVTLTIGECTARVGIHVAVGEDEQAARIIPILKTNR